MPRTPIHPGEHLAEELREIGITAAELSRQIDVPVNRITGIIHGQRGITADTALCLAHWFRHQSAVLDEPAAAVRAASRRNRGWREDRRVAAPRGPADFATNPELESA
jgi:addiction module HigA family antidote